MRKFFVLMLVLSVTVVFFSACVQLNADVPEIKTAEDVLSKAWEAGAEVKAAYEYNSAKAYLEAAKHEKEENDYDAARKFAAKAVEQANKALEKSK